MKALASFLMIAGTCLFAFSAVHAQEELAEGEIWVNGEFVASLQEAFDIVPPGGIIRIGPGTYREAGILKKGRDGVSIYGSYGTIFDGVAAGGKGAFVIASNDTTIEDLTCRNISVRDKNGACVRLEGTNLTLRRVVFENNENGLHAGSQAGNVLVEDSVFDGNGKIGRSHGMYINSGRLTVRRTKVLSSKDQGHGIKSRAERTIIEDSIIASLEGDDSRLIDIPNGGIVAIRRNLLVEGPRTVNWQLLSFGVEGARFENHALRIEGNVIISDRDGGSELIMVHGSMPKPVVRQNMVVGRIKFDWDNSNYFFENRSELNFPPAPQLPDWDPINKD
jgi:hypothetical protein